MCTGKGTSVCGRRVRWFFTCPKLSAITSFGLSCSLDWPIHSHLLNSNFDVIYWVINGVLFSGYHCHFGFVLLEVFQYFTGTSLLFLNYPLNVVFFLHRSHVIFLCFIFRWMSSWNASPPSPTSLSSTIWPFLATSHSGRESRSREQSSSLQTREIG